MKKAIFISPRYLPAMGGVEEHVAKLSTELLKRGWKITVFTVQHEKFLPLRDNIDGVLVERLPFEKINKKLSTWWWIWKRRGIFKKADVVHAHDIFWWYLPLRVWFFKNPIFTTFHGYEAGVLPRWQAILHRRVVEKLSKKTMAIGDFIRKWYGQNPDLVSYGAGEASSPAHSGKPNLAVFIGRLEPDTGIEEYLEIIKQSNSNLNLDVYGEGSLKDKLQKKVNKDHLPVKFCGLTTEPERVIGFAQVVFTSQYLTILKAMQARRLVVAIYRNPMKEDYLKLHPASDFMILAGSGKEALGKILVLSQNIKLKMLDQAYHWARSQTWKNLADQYLSLWQK